MKPLSKKKRYVAEIEGREIQSESDWLGSMAVSFKFPVYSEEKRRYVFYEEGGKNKPPIRAVYEDWMTDLSWIEEDEILLVILHYSEFLQNDAESKTYIINNLKETILPWWETEVVNCVVEGKRRAFNVILVE